LATIKDSGFDSRTETKKNFDILYKTFNSFKKQKDSNIVEHLELMNSIIDYVKSAQFNNFFKEFDKKLTKNVLKRCVIDPFTERIMKKASSPEEKDELEILVVANEQNI